MPGYMWFILSFLALIVGYLIYGKVVEKVFGADSSLKTPAYTHTDGVDYVPMPKWRLFLIQLLNIAGVGPVFGPILGALYGPTALLWVVFGNIFAGAVHDYLSGMMSVRYHGANIPEIIRFTLGNKARGVMLLFTVLPLILAGVVFVTAPAGLLEKLCKDSFNGVLTFSVLVTQLSHELKSS